MPPLVAAGHPETNPPLTQRAHFCLPNRAVSDTSDSFLKGCRSRVTGYEQVRCWALSPEVLTGSASPQNLPEPALARAEQVPLRQLRKKPPRPNKSASPPKGKQWQTALGVHNMAREEALNWEKLAARRPPQGLSSNSKKAKWLPATRGESRKRSSSCRRAPSPARHIKDGASKQMGFELMLLSKCVSTQCY